MQRDSLSNLIACRFCGQPIWAPFKNVPELLIDLNAVRATPHICKGPYPLVRDLAPYCRDCRNTHPRTMTCTEARQR